MRQTQAVYKYPRRSKACRRKTFKRQLSGGEEYRQRVVNLARHSSSEKEGSLMVDDSSPHLERRSSSFHKRPPFGLRLRTNRLSGAVATRESHSMTSVGSLREDPPGRRRQGQMLIAVPEPCFWILYPIWGFCGLVLRIVRVRVLLHCSPV